LSREIKFMACSISDVQALNGPLDLREGHAVNGKEVGKNQNLSMSAYTEDLRRVPKQGGNVQRRQNRGNKPGAKCGHDIHGFRQNHSPNKLCSRDTEMDS
jgi:hypothetical protein